MSHHPTQCQDCRAYIVRERYTPFCERGTYYGGIGCLKRSRPLQTQPEHTGDLQQTPAKATAKPSKKARRR
jgi:hypothetical protein